MKLIVTGSRTWDDTEYIWHILDQHLNTELGIALHHGACPKGADAIADQWVLRRRQEGRSIWMRRWPAQWRDENGIYDPRAGFRRNTDMVKLIASWQGWGTPPKCLAFIRNHSAGATHCANEAAKAGIEVIRYRWEDRSGQLNLLDLIGAPS